MSTPSCELHKQLVEIATIIPTAEIPNVGINIDLLF